MREELAHLRRSREIVERREEAVHRLGRRQRILIVAAAEVEEAVRAAVVQVELAADAARVNVSSAASLAALLATNLGLIVRATPGNVGFFQFVYALTVAAFGVTRSDAIAVSLLIQTIQIIPLTVVGVGLAPEFIFGRGAARRAAESLAHESEPSMIGSLAKEGEELPAVPREP